MPWKEITMMEEKISFITNMFRAEIPFKHLCKEFGISEKTGYKWRARALEGATRALTEKSRRPLRTPEKFSDQVKAEVLKMKEAHPTWGPKKIRIIYAKGHKDRPVPSIGWIRNIFVVFGKVKHRKLKIDSSLYAGQNVLTEPEKPNDVWTVDFKGHWISSGEKCLPLTVRDLFGKFHLEVKLMQYASSDAVRAEFEHLFKEYGLPNVIRSDNGPPFAAPRSPYGFSKLNVWFMSLGIRVERIKKGKPTQNGSHERMHRDISQEIQHCFGGGILATQKALDEWAHEYNYIRPHETLNMKTPADVYCKSQRKYIANAEFQYPDSFITRHVDPQGRIGFRMYQYVLSTALGGYTLGLQPTPNEHEFIVWLNINPLFILDTKICATRKLETDKIS
jgi:transposase-like protein